MNNKYKFTDYEFASGCNALKICSWYKYRMIFDVIYAIFNFVYSIVYRTLNQQVVNNFLAFIRGFEFAIVFMAAIIFLLIAVSIMLKRARKLPHTYEIQIFDLDDREVTVDGLRQVFSTYDAAESFARQYQKTYANQYRFKVTGKSDEYNPPFRA